jgi:hypothetical protein
MPPLNILYYPTWNPPPEYLRSVLLFFDRFEVIIPTDVPAEYDDANARIIDVLPDAFYERRERHYEFDFDASGWQRFERALDLLVEQKPPAKGVRIVTDPDGAMRFKDHVLTHDAKLNDRIKPLLTERKLLRPNLDRLSKSIGRRGFHVVDERAACLILSVLADTLARRHMLRTMTDEPIGFTLNSLNRERLSNRLAVEARLASTILTAEIPETIGVLSPEEYVELRKRYEEIRTPFRRAVRLLYDDHMLDTVSDAGQLEEVMAEVVADYGNGVSRFRKSRLAKRLKNWTSLGLGTLGTALTLTGNFTLGAIGSGLGLSVQFFEKFAVDRPEGDIEQSQRLFCGLRQDLLDPRFVERLATIE